MDRLKRAWKAAWLESPRRGRLERFDQTFPFTGYRKHIDKMTRGQASKIIQIRSGQVPLNSYLFRISKADSPLCSVCHDEQGEEPPPETVNHFLFECKAHDEQRDHLTKKIGRANMNLKSIMKSEKRMRALANFITKTGRLDTGT
jgi:hypothetical protein